MNEPPLNTLAPGTGGDLVALQAVMAAALVLPAVVCLLLPGLLQASTVAPDPLQASADGAKSWKTEPWVLV